MKPTKGWPPESEDYLVALNGRSLGHYTKSKALTKAKGVVTSTNTVTIHLSKHTGSGFTRNPPIVAEWINGERTKKGTL